MIVFLVDSILQFANTKTDHCVEIPAFAIPYYDLTFVLDGTMVYYANEKKYTLRKNDAMLLLPGTVRAREGAKGNFRYVSYNFFFLPGKQISLPEYMPGIVTEEIRKLLAAFPFPNLLNRNYDQEKCASVLNAVLYEMIRLNEQVSVNPYIQKMFRYVAMHITEPISLCDLCQEVRLSKEYGAWLFKHETGKTAVSYVQEQKMLVAREMILRGEMSLQNIALYLGYSNYNYFSRLYKKVFHYSPQKTTAYQSLS